MKILAVVSECRGGIAWLKRETHLLCVLQIQKELSILKFRGEYNIGTRANAGETQTLHP